MDNVNICLQLEGLGFRPLVSDKGIISAFKRIGSFELVFEIKEYSTRGKTIIIFTMENETIFKAVTDNERAFMMNYAMSLYHVKHYIKTLEEKSL